MISGILVLLVMCVSDLKLGTPKCGPLTALMHSVPAPGLTVCPKLLTWLFLMNPMPSLSCGKVIPNRPQALLQRKSAEMTLLFVRVTADRVRNRVVRLESAVIVVMLFLSVVTCPLKMLAAGPTTCAQTPLNLLSVNRCVLRLELPKAQSAARQTGMVWVPAFGVGLRLVRIRRALNWHGCPLASDTAVSSGGGFAGCAGETRK